MESQEMRRFQLGVKALEAVVAVVATLGELVATVTAPRRSVWPLLYPESLHAELKKFIWTLRDTLDHDAVTSLRQRGVTSLSQAMAALGATPGPVPADVRATAEIWREAWDVLEKSWTELCLDAEVILEIFEGEATTEATNEATATSLAGHLWDETLPGRGTAGDSLVAAVPEPSVSLSSVMAALDAPMATGQVGAATRRGQRVEEVKELLERLKDACEGAVEWITACYWLELIEDIPKWTDEPFSDEEMVDKAAEFELLCEASPRLATRHLLVALGEIDFLLSSPYGGSGGPGGPRGRAVAELCKKAMEDIPEAAGGM